MPRAVRLKRQLAKEAADTAKLMCALAASIKTPAQFERIVNQSAPELRTGVRAQIYDLLLPTVKQAVDAATCVGTVQ